MSRIKCVVVGDIMSGKTALLQRCIDNTYKTHKHKPTISGKYNVTWNLDDDIPIDFKLLDTSGSDDMTPYCCRLYKDIDIVLICFSVEDKSYILSVCDLWLPEIRHVCGPSVPIILVATKLDLRDGPVSFYNKHRGVVPSSFAEGFALARQIGAVAYVECSSLDGTGVKVLIDTLLVIAKELKENKVTMLAKVTKFIKRN